MTRWTRHAAALTAALTLAAAPVQAQTGGDDRMQELIEEIRQLMQRAEREDQADPWLIEDVREVLAEYGVPWQRTVYASHFDRQLDGVPEPWRVASGQFRVDSRGLHSLVPTAAELRAAQDGRTDDAQAGTGNRDDAGRDQPSDQMGDLLGAVLEEALDEPGRAQSGDGDRERGTPEPVPARALLPKQMANAFAVRLQVSAQAPSAGRGQLAVGPYQGDQARAGYRLIYRPEAGEAQAAFELMKRGPRGTKATVALSDGAPRVADGETHTVVWTRGRDGAMKVTVDGEPVIQVTDRGFSDPFAGLVVHNAGGDYGFDSLVIKDAG
jgi:hypothetical protein